MKDPNGFFNTRLLKSKGFVSVLGDKPQKGNVDIRCTSDSYGETLSLTWKGIQMAVKVRDIERIIQEARENRGDKA